jgi:hypothetical protein
MQGLLHSLMIGTAGLAIPRQVSEAVAVEALERQAAGHDAMVVGETVETAVTQCLRNPSAAGRQGGVVAVLVCRYNLARQHLPPPLCVRRRNLAP